MSASRKSYSSSTLCLDTTHGTKLHHSPSQSPSPASRRGSRGARTSFVSIREDDGGLAQTFLDVKPTVADLDHPVNHPECNCKDEETERELNESMAMALILQPQPACYCPCGRLDRWKRIRLGGRQMSRSTEDLRAWQFDGEEPSMPAPKRVKATPPKHAAGQSPLERLPMEILESILRFLMTDIPPNGAELRNIDLISCLLTSKRMADAALTVLYRHVTIPHSLIFSKFLAHITRFPTLGTMVRRLDFAHFSSVGLGRTRRMNAEIQMVTAATLSRCLELLPNLHEFLAQEHIDGDIDEHVLGKLFGGLPLLRALDFCACSSSAFRDAFVRTVSRTNPALPLTMPIERLSLHECGTLPASTLEVLLPRLGRLTHLDLGHTLVTPTALARIPRTARLTHLNLSKCTRLTGEAVVNFVTGHPAAKDTLVYLNLLVEPARFRLLSREDVSRLLAGLPSTLKALNLNGAQIGPEHLRLLRPLTHQLEELGLGYAELSLNDIQNFWSPVSTMDANGSPTVDAEEERTKWSPPTLHYLDLTGVPSITPGALLSSSCTLLKPETRPLEVLELGAKTVTGLRERLPSRHPVGWAIRELGRRGWYVRAPSSKDVPAAQQEADRFWKMGALWWGMRKVPVARSEVGGLYGHYMFKR
ncbi:MAG: hypothetical protein M1823_004043 [Watsoniomyces obsoletus]|nr:MAG: hypothetical protein M1823_004043 [Watsoniomyces obsoletus]